MIDVAARLGAAGMSEGAAESRARQFATVEDALRAKGGSARHRIWVPGRIEVLGKHTDYAGGSSLLAAVERGFSVAVGPRADTLVRLIDVGRADEVTLSFDGPAPVGTPPHWAIYPAAVVRRLARDFPGRMTGADIAFSSDLPPSSGLSSSSALVIAVFESLRLAGDLDSRLSAALPSVLDVAAYLGSVESGRPFRNFGGEAGVGTSGGSQDHTAILASEAGRLARFGFAPVRASGSVALPEGLTFAVAVSGVVAQKTAGARAAYNRAAALSAAILEQWQAQTGRLDATLFEAVKSSSLAYPSLREGLKSVGDFGAEALRARLDQFVDECLVLIPTAFEALLRGDVESFGRAVDRSQRGAEHGLENQIPETMELARSARGLGAHAASAFGAGFGGSVWALVPRAHAGDFCVRWERAYRARFDHAAAFLVTDPGPPLTRLSG